jgi:hypothetical protein
VIPSLFIQDIIPSVGPEPKVCPLIDVFSPFLMIFVKIISLALFTTKNNATGRFIAAFTIQSIGLIGTVVLHMISDIANNLITDPQMKTFSVIFPYLISFVIFITIRGIYEVEYFDEKKFFN